MRWAHVNVSPNLALLTRICELIKCSLDIVVYKFIHLRSAKRDKDNLFMWITASNSKLYIFYVRA